MWRKPLNEVTKFKILARRNYADKTVGSSGKGKNWKREMRVLMKSLVSLELLREAVAEENKRGDEKEHVTLLGKRESGIELLGNILLGPCYNEKYKKEQNSRNNGGNMSSALQRFPEKNWFNQRYQRNVSLTFLYSDEVTSATAEKKLRLNRSDDNSVVFCFALSHRFTAEDANVLQEYLEIQQKENCDELKRFSVFFIDYDCLDVDMEDYIEHLPNKFKTFLQKCENKYSVVRFNEELSKRVKNNVKSLIKPVPCNKFKADIYTTIALYVFPYLKIVLMM